MNLTPATHSKWYARVFPSLTDLAFLLPIFILFFKLKGTKTLFADADTGWHIRTGEWILRHGAVPTRDIFSFTRPDQDWFAWEWGWDVLFGAIHGVAGLAGVGFVNVLFLGCFSVLLFTLVRRVSGNDVVSFFVAAIALCASSIHWLARPHLVSLLCAVALMHLIQSAEQGNRKALYFIPLLMVVWTNLHGGFAGGIMIIGCYALGGTLADLLVTAGRIQDEDSRVEIEGRLHCLYAAFLRTRALWLVLFVSCAATLLNPYGWRLHQHIFLYLTDRELLNRISEFQSISFHGGAAPLFEIMLVLGVAAAFWKLQAVRIAPALLILVWAHLALVSARHIPLFVIVAAPPVAELCHYVVDRLRHVAVFSEAAVTFSEICEELTALERTGRIYLTSAAAALLLAVLFAGGKAPFAAEFDADVFPVKAIPVLQAQLAKVDASGPHAARTFTYDQWGDYLIYRLYPAERVFFDGRSDFYGLDFVKVNQRIIGAEYDWKSLLGSYGIDLVIVKPDAPLAAALKLTPGSKVLLDDGKVIVFQIDGIYRQAENAARKMVMQPTKAQRARSCREIESGIRAASTGASCAYPLKAWRGGKPFAQEVSVRFVGTTNNSRSRLSATAHIV
jgi:hypothetical protein